MASEANAQTLTVGETVQVRGPISRQIGRANYTVEQVRGTKQRPLAAGCARLRNNYTGELERVAFGRIVRAQEVS